MLLAFLLASSASPIAPQLQAQETPQAAEAQETEVNAADLVKAADRAIAYAVAKARESDDPALSQDNEEAKPFWQALARLNEAVEKVDRGLTLQDETFHTNLALATSAVEEVKITFGMAEARDSAVIEGIEKTDVALALLRDNYSKEAARLKKGGDLTPEEVAQLEKIKGKQAELQKRLDEVEGKVANNETLKKGVQQLKKKSQQVSNSRSDVPGFLFAMTAMNIMNGWLWGWHWWWGPWGPWAPGYIVVIQDIYVDALPYFDYDWDLADDYVDYADYEELEGYDLEVEFDAAEFEAMDTALDPNDFVLPGAETMDMSADELAHEGEMDVMTLDDFNVPDNFGDFGAGDVDMGAMDMDMDMGGFDDF
jgi:hypothetical protein